ncbi:hypothetical protein PMKS-003479 [Pichia membranifaciens]|uniref:Uncharacterized protein n=1 Tax=Pichia membranifaciens TaxID=4926 RepID=A0A1Q2YKS2_9ASCO|nr:hypothetical protein PMKS-003479 [Pichia membranifaciens]
MEHLGTKSTLLQKSIKQRKLGLLKQQQQTPQQQSVQLSFNSAKKGTFNDDIKYLQQLTQELLFETTKASETKRLAERSLPPLTSSNDLDVRLFPILLTFLQAIFQLMLKVSYLKRFISNSIKRVICEKALKCTNAEKLVDFLRHMMFPEDGRCQMKSRYIPQNEEELKAVYDFNFAELVKFLSNDSKLSRMLLSRSEAHNPTLVEAKAKCTMHMFKHRQINQVLIQKLIDLTIARIFPELQIQDTVSMFKIHQ